MFVTIVANGDIEDFAKFVDEIRASDYIIAADGGAKHCLANRLDPDLVIGDLDSLSQEDFNRLRSRQIEIIQFPVTKDKTDLELAIDYAVKHGASQVNIFGALGKRIDMTLANVLLLTQPDYREVTITLVDNTSKVTLIRSEQRFVIHGSRGDTVSLIPLKGDAKGVTATGLAYPLTNDVLYFGATRGVSNQMVSDEAGVFVASGFLLCIQQQGNLIHGDN